MADNLVDSLRQCEMTLKYSDGDDSLQKTLNKLRDKNYYENVFSWDLRKASKDSKEITMEFNETIDKIRTLQNELQLVTNENGSELFNLQMFCFKLIVCYELYANEKYDESLLEAEDFVKYMNSVTFDKSDEQYIESYNHILKSTYGFIMISMNINNSEEKIKSIKLQSELNDIEKSAIHAVKALVYMKYPFFHSKHIAFNEAAEAYALNSSNAEWIHIWLRTKGQFNREYNNFEKLDYTVELKMAEKLFSISESFWHLIAVSNVFMKVYKQNKKEEKYFELAFKNMSRATELAGNNKHLIIKCLNKAIDQPKLLLSKSTVEEKMKILQNFEHPHINALFGNYYLKHEKDYKKAKDYFIRGKETDVLCVLNMLKVECILKPLDEIPFIETLIDAFYTFPTNEKGRIKILSQILLYCTYCEEDNVKIINFFKLYMDQPFDYAFKYQHLISVVPIFKIKLYDRNKYVEDLFNKMKYIFNNYKCNLDEKNNDPLRRFSKMVTEALNNTHLKQLGLDHLNISVRAKLDDIINNYESIFSWNIKQLTGKNNNLMMELIDVVREKIDNVTDKEDEFSEIRFYLNLIMSYEHYTRKSYNESLSTVKSVIECLESRKFDDTNQQYLNAYKHIAKSTYAYIALISNLDSEMEDIKPVNCLNKAELAAICAVKAKVFLEYPPKGNNVALEFAEKACRQHSIEPKWKAVWLKAKGRVRRYNDRFSMPDTNELKIAKEFCLYKTTPILLIQAAQVYAEAGHFCKFNRTHAEASEYYKLSSNLLLSTIKLANDDIGHLTSCLLEYVEYPTEFQPELEIEKLIKKLSEVKNSFLNQALGKYYLKHKKDYKKAQEYLSKAMACGHFGSALLLIKAESLLQPIHDYPFVQTLNMIYDSFPSPERRLTILSQIIMYYYYYENNTTIIMHYLKLYMDQDIDDAFKKRTLINTYPSFKVKGYFKPKSFLDILFSKVNNMKNYHNLSIEEKITFDRFNKMSKLNLYENQVVNDNKTGVYKQNDGNITNSGQRYPNKTSYNNRNWRKQQNYGQSSSTKY